MLRGNFISFSIVCKRICDSRLSIFTFYVRGAHLHFFIFIANVHLDSHFMSPRVHLLILLQFQFLSSNCSHPIRSLCGSIKSVTEVKNLSVDTFGLSSDHVSYVGGIIFFLLIIYEHLLELSEKFFIIVAITFFKKAIKIF
jgi:hypothetical protein